MAAQLSQYDARYLDSSGRAAAHSYLPMATAQDVRATLALSPDMRRIVERLAAESGTDEAEVFRRAIGLLKIVKEGQQRGESPALVDKTGRVTTEIVGV